jgi:hypothetical protein
MRIDSEHAVDAANDSSSRSANNPTNKATDRSEHAVTSIGTPVYPVVHPPRHALRLCSDRRGEKETDSDHTEHSHLVSLFICATPIVHHDVGTFLLLLGEIDGLTGIPLIEPNASHLIGLVASDRDPLPPVARGLLDVARRLDMGTTIDREIGHLSSAALA